MVSNFQRFKNQLDQAVELIEKNTSIAPGNSLVDNIGQSASLAELVDTQSLLARCNSICEKYEKKKPTIRIIHHLACSGGTLISKCISAMPNVYLLSEVHPYTDLALGKGKPKYAPSDITSLTKYAGIPKQYELAGKLFQNAIDEVSQHVEEQGGILVLRDHTHSDFNVEESIPKKSRIIKLLENKYEIKSVLTIRNPIDSYLSLVKNNWVHFEPKNFEEYCRRLLLLVAQFNDDDIFVYDDFVENSSEVMLAITNQLSIPFDNVFEDVFSVFRVTGDSGRSSSIIAPRERQSISEDYQQEINSSTSFRKLIDRFNFK